MQLSPQSSGQARETVDVSEPSGSYLSSHVIYLDFLILLILTKTGTFLENLDFNHSGLQFFGGFFACMIRSVTNVSG